MKQIFTTLIFIFGLSFWVDGQSFSTQILNKGGMESNVSLLQDFDGDVDLDIIVSRENPAGVYWLENEPTKQFPLHLMFSQNITYQISDIDAADIDNDGDIDYVVSMTNVSTGELAWFQRQPDDTFIKWTISVGKDFHEIIKQLPLIKDRIKVYYVVDTLNYLIKGGRIGKVAGTLGELLKIKPIISVNEEGVYYSYTKVRGRRQSISKLIEIANQTLTRSKAKIWVLQGGALEEGKNLYQAISKLPNITEINFGDISPVLGVHTGPGLLGIVIMQEE